MVPRVLYRSPLNSFRSRSLAAGFKQFHDEFDALFNSRARRGGTYPALRVYANGEEALVRAALPGVKAEALELKIEGGLLSFKGEKEAGPDGTVRRREQFDGHFSRRVELPFEVEADKVEAAFENGVLTVRLPRVEVDKPRAIEIKTA